MAWHGWPRRCLGVVLGVCGCADDGVAVDPTQESSGAPTSSSVGETSGTTGIAGSTGSSSGPSSVETGSEDGAGPLLDVGVIPDAGGGEQPLEPIPSSCAAASAGGSSVGCEFFAVDLDMLDDNVLFAVVVSNVQLDAIAEVVVERKLDGDWTPASAPTHIGPLGQHIFGLPDNHQEGSGVLEGGAYRVRASVPVAAYQFNPLAQGLGPASSDASLLLPVASWDHLNQAIGWNPDTQNDGHAMYISVAAAVDGTVVTVTPPASPDPGLGVPAVGAGTPFDIELDSGDVVQVAFQDSDSSVTGTRIDSDAAHPIAVFSGGECSEVLVYACDHLEEQLTGVRQWGLDYVAARVPPRRPEEPETSVWHIYASEDDTTISLTGEPAVTGLPATPVELDAGEVLQLEVGGPPDQPGDFVVHADHPIAVLNYMTGNSAIDPLGVELDTGDPLMVQLPPVEQFLPRYVVLVPPSWSVDMITLVRSGSTSITIDGVEVDDDAFIQVGEYEVARLLATDGVHAIESDVAFGVSVTGWAWGDSYGYAGGYGTGIINPTPEG